MKNGTNLFFLIVAAGFVYFGWREYQKQVEAQKALQQQKATDTQYRQVSPYRTQTFYSTPPPPEGYT